MSLVRPSVVTMTILNFNQRKRKQMHALTAVVCDAKCSVYDEMEL